MKTFTSISKYREGTAGFERNGRNIVIIEADPKREGLYKMGMYITMDGEKTTRHSLAYGKSRQSEILEASKDMIEVK